MIYKIGDASLEITNEELEDLDDEGRFNAIAILWGLYAGPPSEGFEVEIGDSDGGSDIDDDFDGSDGDDDGDGPIPGSDEKTQLHDERSVVAPSVLVAQPFYAN